MSNGLLNVVIIAKKNTSMRFLRTLESIKSQVYTPIEIIVVDTNEQNSMYSLGLQEDLSLNPEVKYLSLDQSLSAAEIRNYLLDRLEGEYIAFLNNDTWDVIMALSQINHLKSNPLAAASCVNGILIDERKPGNPIEPLREGIVSDSSKWVLHNPAKMSAQIIYLAKALKEAGGFDKQFTWLCDADMVLRLSKRNKVVISSVSLCECLLTSAAGANYELDLFDDFRKFRIKHMDYLLVNKQLAQEYYGMMIQLARNSYMWLDLLIYAVMYFIKGPFRTIGFLLSKLIHIIRYTIRGIIRELSLIKERLRLVINMGKMSRGKKVRSKAAKNKASSKKNGELVLTFMSAKQYNEQNSLTYVFNQKLNSVVIPEHVTVIKKGMFYGCSQLVSVEIPNTVQEIGAHAFQNCVNLRNVIFQDKGRLNKIGDYAFAGCGLLKEINLPSSVTQMGVYSFAECYSLTRLMFDNRSLFPTSIQKISKFTFAGCRSLESVEFEPNSILEIIENGAFLGCHDLQKIILTGRVKSLGAYALAYCNQVESVALLQVDSLKFIGKSAFMRCESLPYFQMPNNLERIRSRTFYGCSKLKFIKIPKKVLSINHQAFRKCSLLSEVLMLSGDIMISATAFDNHTELKIQDIVDSNKS